MSKASEWAEHFEATGDLYRAIERERPAEFHMPLIGLAGLTFNVTDRGRPEIKQAGGPGTYPFYQDHETLRLIELARWILDTFGEEAK